MFGNSLDNVEKHLVPSELSSHTHIAICKAFKLPLRMKSICKYAFRAPVFKTSRYANMYDRFRAVRIKLRSDIRATTLQTKLFK